MVLGQNNLAPDQDLSRLQEYLSYLMMEYLSGFTQHLKHFFDSAKVKEVRSEVNRLALAELRSTREQGFTSICRLDLTSELNISIN